MNIEQQKAILTIALYAAFADGNKDDREREQIRRLTESLGGGDSNVDLAGLYQDVLLKKISQEAACTALSEAGERQLAYEMAVCVCDADGRQSASERRFLDGLKKSLQLNSETAAAFEHEAEALVELTETVVPDSASTTAEAVPVAAIRAHVNEAELDKSILNNALLNGALELLPQSWASLAIVPLQMKMVYTIGKAHGVGLDQGHIKEFLAAAGVGLTSQSLEQLGRKLFGGLLGKMAGKTLGTVGGAATGMAFSFATTYSLGHLAKRYYAGGRVMNTSVLRDTFENLLEPAKQLQAQYLPQIRQQAETLDMGRVLAMVRGR